ncbi:hypothetical protein BC943DRAFT_320152 [Umbelopsis sp. AD052]|nr:hypothetical protein BC943DRAFT_320152 [Umbelopsis sp. AD052]
MKASGLLLALTLIVCSSRLTNGAPTAYTNTIMADADETDVDAKSVAPVGQAPQEIQPLFRLTPEQSEMLNGKPQADPLPQPDGVQRIHSINGKETL